MATAPIDKIKLNTLDPNMLFAKWYPWRQFLDLISKYPNVHGARAFLNWMPGKGRGQDNADALPFVWDAKAKKWDISRWNDAYRTRFSEIVKNFASAKKHLILSLIDYCTWREESWSIHPFNRKNNLSGPKHLPWGTMDLKMSHWTGGKEVGDSEPGKPINEILMLRYWMPALEEIKALVPSECRQWIKIEVCNEPQQSLDPANIIVRWLQQFYGWQKSQDCMSITGPMWKKFCEYSKEYDWKGNVYGDYVSVCRVHGARTPAQFKAILSSASIPALYKGIYFAPDTDGAKLDNGEFVAQPKFSSQNNNVTLLKPGEITAFLAAYPSLSVMLHCDDIRHSEADWKKTFATAEKLCKAF